MLPRSSFALTCVLVAGFLVGCDDEEPTALEPPGLQVSPAFRGVPETDTVRLVATFNGDPVAVTWESSNPAVATVSAQGLVTALVPGFTAITATGPNQQKRSSSITVVAVTALTSGTAVTVSQAGPRGTQLFRKITVPAGATGLTVTTSGGTGDVDMYVRYGAVPTPSNWDCRPFEAGNAETCTFANPAAGTWFIMLETWDPYSVSLRATVTP